MATLYLLSKLSFFARLDALVLSSKESIWQRCICSANSAFYERLDALMNIDNHFAGLRMMELTRQVISNEVARPTQIPGGLSLFRAEIAGIAGQFARLVSHNRAVFAQSYADLIVEHCLH